MRPVRRLLLSLMIGAIALPHAVASPVPLPKPVYTPKPVTGAQIKADMGLTGEVGWILVDLDTGRVLDEGAPDRAFAPASVAKLPTAAFAIDALGADYRFETQLVTTAAQRGDILPGDLVLKGGGNPELDTDALLPMAQRLAQTGIREVRGRFVVDGSALPQLPEIEISQAEHSSYNPSVSGLNLNFNRVHVKWDARKGRDSLSVEAAAERLSPPVEGVRVAVAQTKGGPIFSLDQSEDLEVWSMAARAFRGRAARWLPVKRPELYAGEVFRTLATEQGVGLPVPERAEAAHAQTVIASHQSRPLSRILRGMLRYSVNLTAEVTGTAATRALGFSVDTLPQSAEVMNDWAASVAGFPAGDPGFRFVNHSGLTIDSRVSPRRMAQLLVALSRREGASKDSHPMLPGAIAGYLKTHNVAAEDVQMDYDNLHVVAKTGTMNYVRGLAGYISTPGGRKLAFAIFSNDLARRANGAQRVNRGWMGRAKGFERALIRNWVLATDQPA